jgi:endoglucanase
VETRRRARWRRATTFWAASLLVGSAIAVSAPQLGISGLPSTITAEKPNAHSNPLEGRPFYVDPASSAAVAAAAALPPVPELNQIAEIPQVRWLDSDDAIEVVAAEARNYVHAAEAVGALPLLAIYAVPHRDCGSFSMGGMATAQEYRDWVDQVALGVGTSAVAIVIEPDALTSMDCLAPAQQEERLELLRFAVSALSRNPNSAVYIDGGHSRWLPERELARRLRAVDVNLARGFALNTSNFLPTHEQIAYGERVSLFAGGARYVIDTSRNGAGPAPDAPLNWCNPEGRAVGVEPTTDTAGAHADAYLWIKHPGESDGDCGQGDPQSGLFMDDYAVALIRNAGR